MRRDLEAEFVTDAGRNIDNPDRGGSPLYMILAQVFALKNPSVIAYFGDAPFLVNGKVGATYQDPAYARRISADVVNGILNALAYLYASKASLEKVPEELSVCLQIMCEGHFSALIAKVTNFRQLYIEIERQLKDQQVAFNDLSDVQGNYWHNAFWEVILPLKDKIYALFGGSPLYSKENKNFNAEEWDRNASRNASIVLKEITKNNKIDLIHFDSADNNHSFNAINSHIDTKLDYFNKPQNLACSSQKGQTCPEHTAYNLFIYTIFGKVPDINKPGTVSSSDLRKLNTSRYNLHNEDFIRFATPYLEPYLSGEKTASNTALNNAEKKSTQKDLAIQNLRTYAQQLKEEYRKKYRVLWFFCPHTKQNKAARLEKLAAAIDVATGDWMKLITAEKQFADTHPFQNIISHRTKNLLGNIIGGNAERGILGSKEKVATWVPGKARFW